MTDMAVDAYEVPSLTVEVLESVTIRHLRKWLGITPSFTSIGLYGKSNKLQLTLSSLMEDSQDKTDANVERFSRRTYPWRRDCNSNWQEVVSNRDCEPCRELPYA